MRAIKKPTSAKELQTITIKQKVIGALKQHNKEVNAAFQAYYGMPIMKSASKAPAADVQQPSPPQDRKLSRKAIKRHLQIFRRNAIDKPQLPASCPWIAIDEYYSLNQDEERVTLFRFEKMKVGVVKCT